MPRLFSARRAWGVTLTELLVVIAIILLLLGLIGVIAIRAHEKAKTDRTRARLKRIALAMQEYHTFWREYPSGDPLAASGSDPEVWPDPYDPAGVDFDIRYLTEREPMWESVLKSDLDPTNPNFMIDAWGHRIRYRKIGVNEYLVWSWGENEKDEIGVGAVWDDDAGSYGTPVPNADKVKQLGDDLTNEDVDNNRKKN
ncbi:MAG: hypothetical protein M5U26_20740 [Planctomycetota bacterium]|nr:hypothetical protein [Planctomycetota bacterium]